MFNDFLGTRAGSLITITFELIVFIIIGYMLFSEFIKTRKSDLKYLGVGFSLLLISKVALAISLLFYVFVKKIGVVTHGFIPVISHFIELLGLLIISFGFLYPVYKKEFKKYYTLLQIEAIGLLVLSAVLLLHWLSVVFENPGLSYEYNYFGYSVLEMIKLIILIATIYAIIKFQDSIGKYSFHLAFAFCMFTIPSVMTLSDIVFFDGGSKFLKALAHPFPFLAGLLLIRVTFLKVVDKAILQQKLSKAEEKSRVIERVAKMKEEFVSMVSHELRTPLTSMKLYISLLLSDQFGNMNKEQKKTAVILKSETDRLSTLIEDILSLSKLEQEKQKLNLAEVNLHDVVEETVYYHLAQKKKIMVKNKVPLKCKAVIDTSKFKQVIINLFGNAVKFTQPKGVITISAKSNVLENSWEFIFSDTGKGIPQEHIPKLFDKFYQVEHHMTREQGGTGLGLAIVKNIVELHKGTITVASEVGKGTTFKMVFPRTISQKEKVMVS